MAGVVRGDAPLRVKVLVGFFPIRAPSPVNGRRVGSDRARSLGSHYDVPNALVNNWTACEVQVGSGQPYKEYLAELAGGPVQPARA
jgi:hypothetical protein